ANDDTLTGTSQNDIITPNAGTDTVDAGDGDDLIVMGAELTWADSIDGGEGTDTLTYTSTGEDTDALDGVTNVEKVVFGDAGTWAAPCDSVVGPEETLIVDGSALSANSALNFNGSQESNGFFSITGGAGDDTLTGGQLADTISGAAGSDILVGGAGADTLTGGAGADYFKYYAAAQGGDSVSDFTHGTDFFSFADSSFGMIPVGVLSEFNFSYEDAATYGGTTDFGSGVTKGFVYCSESDPESGTGKLYYDPDSGTVGGETLIAVVTETNGDVTNTDITIFEYAV
ncbi:MAG: calcium-binding protein, partial [Desulfovibrionaceae bacterium]|nr:calcium-binding protein [Desulfovibrionaceae bacterium]